MEDSKLPLVCSLEIPGDLADLRVGEGEGRRREGGGRPLQPLSCILRRLKSLGPTLTAIPGCSRIGLKCLSTSAALKMPLLPKPGLWEFALCKGRGGVGSIVTASGTNCTKPSEEEATAFHR